MGEESSFRFGVDDTNYMHFTIEIIRADIPTFIQILRRVSKHSQCIIAERIAAVGSALYLTRRLHTTFQRVPLREPGNCPSNCPVKGA